MMAEYIKRYDAMKICQKHSTHCFSVSDARGQDVADKIEDEIAEIPTADVVEVKHGEWNSLVIAKNFYYCSECNRHIKDTTKMPYEHFPYCHCGAKMDKERRDT